MRRLSFVATALGMASLVGTPTALSQGKPAQPARKASGLFARYPKSSGLDAVIRRHKVAATDPLPWDSTRTIKDPHILYATWFLDGRPKVAMDLHVDIVGRVYTVREVHDWASQGSALSALGPVHLEAVKKNLRALPSSTPAPPFRNLLILSYRNGKTWTTRTYDRTHLPEAVRQLYRITGADLGVVARTTQLQ